jgi:LysR family transcriptional regulator, mexEF-oprN operon transcriptional activator
MQTINVSDIKKIDLNLALVFYVIYEKRSASAAAKALYVTQPAISASLSRLRDMCGDGLFVREGRGLRPTPYADDLARTLKPVLAQLQKSLKRKEEFVPETSRRVFRVGFADGLEMGLTPAIARSFQAQAPLMKLSVRGTDFHSIESQIERDELDLAVGVFENLPKTVHRKPLHRLHFRMLYDPTQIQVRSNMSLERYLALGHVLVSYREGFSGLFEARNEKKGLARNIVFSLARFSAVPYLIQGSSLVCTMPDYLAYRFARTFGLATIAAPFVDDSFEIELVWPVYLDREPDHMWLRELFRKHVRLKDLVGL